MAHTFPQFGDPDDMPCAEFDAMVGRAAAYEKWKRGDDDGVEGMLDRKMREVLRQR